MKTIFLTAVICANWVFAFTQISVYDCALDNPEVTQQEIEATNNFYKPCIKFEEGINYNFNTNPNGTREVKASPDGSIHIEKNFHAGRYTGNSRLNLKLQNERPFDVWVMNYNALNGIRKLDKFELGVQLPQEIHEKVENFVNDETGDKINPFLEWEIKVVAEFSYLLTQFGDYPIFTNSIDGYYSRDYQPYMNFEGDNFPTPSNATDTTDGAYDDNEYRALGGYDLIENDDPNFRVRFAPPITGKWRCIVKIILPNETVVGIPFEFYVVNSNKKGYLKTGPNGHFFTRDGQSFFPIGCNLPWPVSAPEYDLAFHSLLTEEGTWAGHENYRETYAIPRVYDKYREKIGEIHSKGANMFRMMMFPSATDLEWEKLGNYTDRLHMAQELDEILEYCESKDMMILWTMQNHFPFGSSTGAYYVRWAWDSEHSDGERFCYADLLGYDLNSIFNFLIDPIAKEYFQQKMRYYISRWGYSTNVGIFELFSENNLIGQGSTSGTVGTGNQYNPENTPPATWNKFPAFQLSVMNYLNSFYNCSIHLSTTSFATPKRKNDDIFTSNSSPFSVTSSNLYNFEFGNYNFWLGYKEKNADTIFNTPGIAKQHLHLNGGNPYVNNTFPPKPMIISETGAQREDLLACEERCCFKGECDAIARRRIENHRHFWHSHFSGCAGAFSWDDVKYPYMFNHYSSAQFLLNAIQLSQEQWHPGQMKLNNNGQWEYKRRFAKRMRDATSFKATLSFLRKGNKKAVIGVVTNNTFNYINQLSSIDNYALRIDSLPDGTLAKVRDSIAARDYMQQTEDLNLDNENLKFKGMSPFRYHVNYYDPVTLSPFLYHQSWGPEVRLKNENLPATESGYIAIVTAIRFNETWMSLYDNDIEDDNISDPAINEVDSTNILISPNPSERITTIDLASVKIREMTVFSSSGRKIYSVKNITKPTLELNISSWKKGTYFFHFISEDYKILIKKFVKI